ncbi:conserved hypothetical protein [Streptomyces scabiei 87.22]|uniref:Uncharacterized protein n=1 Tax=Streptomyces scabiei (strain 87.22) TaxID=680198 RepID=C9YXI9_STRSW|nr:hypothetical protein [Streptomyces scabiei]MDX3143997.1 hypothetical protein [Streptomyces scabiei]MDX3178505.1 hypothetical protein [Streptomyces scabiei]CBG69343.1 conserved hypothetical protein [Streptomyces scabiei 87.22]
MAADGTSTPDARRAAPLAPLPDHRNVDTPWWQELWRRHVHITTPLRERGLECDIEFGLSAYIVRVSLPDDSYLIISPPQEPPSERPPGDPEGWIATREHPDDQELFEVVYDSAPSDDPGGPQRPEGRHGGNAQPLIEAIDHRLAQLGLLPHPPSPTTDPHVLPATPVLHGPEAPDVPGTSDRAPVYIYGDAMLALTDRLNGAESHADAAALLHQILDPVNGLLERLGEFFEAAGEKAKEAEEDDGFDLSYDLADAAAEIRNLAEVLHMAEDRMRALTPLVPAPRLPSTPSLPPRALPSTPPKTAPTTRRTR